MFDESLHAGYLESYFPFHSHGFKCFEGLRVWRGIWRWFAEDNLILPKALEVVEREGITVDEFEHITE
eukprot:gene25523-17785_t